MARAGGACLFSTCSLFIIVAADNAARRGDSDASWLFWLGLAGLFLPAAFCLLSAEDNRVARLAVTVVVSFDLYMVKLLHSPVRFTFHDEFGQWRATRDILVSHHLFRASPLDPAYPQFPALNVTTAALAGFAHCSIYTAGIVVIGLVRILMTVGLVLLFEAATRSTRLATIAALVYMTNPNFVFFDSQFSYESFALPVMAVLIALALRASRMSSRRESYAAIALAAIALTCLVVTAHHMTSYITFALLAVVAVDIGVRPPRARRSSREQFIGSNYIWEWNKGGAGLNLPRALAVSGAILSVAWLALVARTTAGYLYPVLRDSVSSLYSVVSGTQTQKTLFRESSGVRQPLVDRGLGLLSVAFVFLLSIYGVFRAWRSDMRSSPYLFVMTLCVIVYPATLALRLTSAGTETSNRASEFAFFGLALGVAVALESRPIRNRTPVLRALLSVGVLAVILAGGLIVGWAPYDRLPGPFLVAADSRSMNMESLAASSWLKIHYGSGNRIAADRENKLIFGAFGGQQPPYLHGQPEPVPEIYFDSGLRRARRVITADRIQFVVVDMRLASALPAIGHYFEPAEARASSLRRPIAKAALKKFDRMNGLTRIYDNGPIRIYRTWVRA
ncbi:MAG TPA: hypothetical protein VGU02_11120 [Gaiellaceae bacterium]|nr:hypothetical protein [Gaiellaceae bacterium]